MNKSKVMNILEKRGLNPLKKLGQNFLVDDNLTKKIVDSIDYNNVDLIIEIGPGLGALTEYLLKKNIKYVGIELDKGASDYLIEEYKENDKFSLISEDFLKVDIEQVFSKYENITIISNLPYYITTPIIEKIITSQLKYKSLTFMMQKEVGERILSKPNSKKYSSLSIFIQYYSNVRHICNVKPNSYFPEPNVDSIVIELSKKHFEPIDNIFFKFVQRCFNARRKTILNNLNQMKELKKEEIEKILIELNIRKNLRPENLDVDDFINLYKQIEKQKEVNKYDN